jgi:uncharacterized protein (TIGR02270 family)
VIPASRTRWDIYEEHLDEASFLFTQWEEALCSPHYTLQEIAEGPEERLLAHLDGLVLGGQRVAKKLLLSGLEGEAGVAFASGFTLASAEDGDFLRIVVGALPAAADPAARAAIRRALAVARAKDLGPRLQALLPGAGDARVDVLDVLGSLRVDPGGDLDALAVSGDPAAQVVALRLGRLFPVRLDPQALELALRSDAPEVRAAALETGMVVGRRGAYDAVKATLAGKEPGLASAALLMGLSGEPGGVEALREALEEPEAAHAAVYALGFTGRVEAAEALLDAMRSEALAPLAVEGFSAITGLRIEKGFARPAKAWNPDDEEDTTVERYGPEADLPEPEPDAVARWWKDARPRFSEGQRWLRGQPWGLETVLGELREGPARRREALALDLAVRSQGRAQLAWDALSATQWKELGEARAMAGRFAERAYGEIAPGR